MEELVHLIHPAADKKNRSSDPGTKTHLDCRQIGVDKKDSWMQKKCIGHSSIHY
jgi:hypothetical protein